MAAITRVRERIQWGRVATWRAWKSKAKPQSTLKDSQRTQSWPAYAASGATGGSFLQLKIFTLQSREDVENA
jgi:hypothetical protein